MKARTDDLFLFDIAASCRKIANYLGEVTKGQFDNDSLLQDGVVRSIEIIGEASKSLSSELREQSPQIELREIMRMRDKIVHHYFKLDLEVVWQTATVDVPALRDQIDQLLTELPEEND